MGFLTRIFKRQPEAKLTRLPSGTFTVDPNGRILSSTVPQSFPQSRLREIGHEVVSAFQAAKNAKLPLSEIILHYASYKITARELRGGAIVFLAPKTLHSTKAVF